MIGEVLGNYRITAQIGSGGMGIVYSAEHILLGKKAAIKVLKPERCKVPEIVERFFNEARAASMVKDPGIPEIFDYGRLPEGNAFLVMEMLEGLTLGQLLDQRAKLNSGRSVSLARLIAGTLKATHAHGIIHRDLKPDNVFVVPDAAMPRGERIQILDFGIAKLQRNDFATKVQTETGRLMGTPYYMSPEQCRGAGYIDHRTDIYSLGCVIYQMISGRPPFYMQGSGEVLAAHIHLAPKPLSLLEPSVPEALEELVMQILEKDADRRPQSMQCVMDRLNDLASFAGAETPEPSLAASVELLGDTMDDIPTLLPRALIPKTTTLESSSGEFTTGESERGFDLPQRSRLRSAAAAAAVSVALAGGVWGAWTAMNVEQPVTPEPMVVQAKPLPPMIVRELVEVPEKIIKVTLSLDSLPTGARVYRSSDGVEIGRTPLQVVVRQGTGKVTFLVRKSGFKVAEIEMLATEDQENLVELSRKRRGKHSSDEASKEPDNSSIVKTDEPDKPDKPELGRDDAIDPF